MNRRTALAALALAGCTAASEPRAPGPAIKPVMQHVEPVPEDHGPQRVEVLTRDVAPDADIPWHTHAGVEILYVENGEMEVFVAGEPVEHLRAGEHRVFERGVVHSGRNPGSEPVRLVITYVLDRDAPQRTPADAPDGN